MSVIVAVTDGKRVCLACDSQATNNGAKATLASPAKIVRRGALLFGCGHLTIIDAVRYAMPEPELPTSLREWAAGFFVPWLLKHLNERGLMFKAQTGEAEFPTHTLIAHRGEFVQVDAGTGVIEFAEPYAAIGSGMYDARGAMWTATRDADGEEYMPKGPANAAIAEYVATLGVQCAIANDNGCGPPCVVEWTS